MRPGSLPSARKRVCVDVVVRLSGDLLSGYGPPVGRRRYLLRVVSFCAAVGVAAGCGLTTSSPVRASSAPRAGFAAPKQCTQRLGRELLAVPAASRGVPPVNLVVGTSLWLRFTGGGWSRPRLSDRTVARFRFVIRCPHGVTVAALRALAPGSAHLSAIQTSPEVDSQWGVAVAVTRHRLSTPLPASSRLINGGGMLVWPKQVNLDGVTADFAVPHVTCQAGKPSQIRVGVFGVRRFVPPTGQPRIAAWWTGLLITCSAAGHATYHVGYTGKPYSGPVHPGDTVDVEVTAQGGRCRDTAVGVTHPVGAGVSSGAEYGGLGCATGKHDTTRIIIQSTMLLGAHVSGPGLIPVNFTLHPFINTMPYPLVPHMRRNQGQRANPVVKARPTNNWYRTKLTIA